jgi:hypothetical protein
MIVISHPWEFVPKGSSHLNSQQQPSSSSSSSSSTSTTTTLNQKLSTADASSTASKSNTPNLAAASANNFNQVDTQQPPTTSSSSQQQLQLPHPQFYLQKSHLSRIFPGSGGGQAKSSNSAAAGGLGTKVQFQNVVASGEDSSLSDISFAYLHNNKSPLVNRINFDTNVNVLVYFFRIFKG